MPIDDLSNRYGVTDLGGQPQESSTDEPEYLTVVGSEDSEMSRVTNSKSHVPTNMEGQSAALFTSRSKPMASSNPVQSIDEGLYDGKPETGARLWLLRFKAMFYKRCLNAIRDRRAIFSQIALPAVFVLLGGCHCR